jgi:hypothetical protein
MGLQVQNLRNVISCEDVMTASNLFLETQAAQQLAQLTKLDIRIGCPTQNTI